MLFDSAKKALFSNMWTTESHSSWSISLIKTVCFSDLHRFEVTSLPMATKCHQLPQSVKSPQSKPLKSIKLTRIDGAGSENSSKKKHPPRGDPLSTPICHFPPFNRTALRADRQWQTEWCRRLEVYQILSCRFYLQRGKLINSRGKLLGWQRGWGSKLEEQNLSQSRKNCFLA